jgi:hypothetical protein
LSLGFDPIWFGVIMTINMEMGLITPPVGLNLYVLKGISPHIALKEILIGSVPFICVLGIAIALFSVSRRSFCSCRNCCIESLTPVVDLGGGFAEIREAPTLGGLHGPSGPACPVCSRDPLLPCRR